MKNSIKSLIGLVLSALLLVSVAGCGSSNQSASTSTESSSGTVATSTQAEAPKEVKTLSLMLHTSWYEWKGAQAVFDLVNSKAELGAKLEFEKLPEGDSGDQIVLTRFASGDAPDLLYWYGSSGKLNAEKSFVELDKNAEWTKNFGDALGHPNYTSNDKLYGVPFGETSCFVNFYNKKVFEDAGLQVPKTWEEFLQVCETLKGKGITPVYYSGKDAWTLQLIPLIGQVRENKIADPKTIAEELEANKRTYTSLKKFEDSINKSKELLDKGYAQKTWISDTYQQAQQALLDGKAAMYPQGTWVINELNKLNADKVKTDIGAMAIPFDGTDDKINTGATYAMFACKDGKNVETSKQVVEFMGSSEALNTWFSAQPGVPYSKNVKVDFEGPLKDINDMIAAGNTAMNWDNYFTKGYSGGDFARLMQEFLVGGKTSTQVLEQMDKDWVKSAKAKNDPNFK